MDRAPAVEGIWQPFCGAEFGRCAGGGQSVGTVAAWPEIAGHVVSGDPIVCDLEAHSPGVSHHNTELGFSWHHASDSTQTGPESAPRLSAAAR